MLSRSEMLDDAMAAPDAVEIVPGVRIRRRSAGSLAMCSRAGVNLPALERFSAAKSDAEAFALFPLLSEFIFIHAAPIEEVERVVYSALSELPKAADRFFAKIPEDRLGDVVAAIVLDAKQIEAAQAEAIPRPGASASKNAPSPAESLPSSSPSGAN